MASRFFVSVLLIVAALSCRFIQKILYSV